MVLNEYHNIQGVEKYHLSVMERFAAGFGCATVKSNAFLDALLASVKLGA
jgi:hypothetical protein